MKQEGWEWRKRGERKGGGENRSMNWLEEGGNTKGNEGVMLIRGIRRERVKKRREEERKENIGLID